MFEGSKCITLLLHWNNSPVSAVVINEGDPIFVAMSGLDRQWTMDIRVNQLERSGGSVRCLFGDIRPVLLASNARFTDRIWSAS